MKNINAKTQICMVIGDPIHHSLSPQMHNAGYKKLGIDDKYVYVACNVKIERIEDFVKGIKSTGIRGVSCTIPHKIEIMKYLDDIDITAKKIGAVNTVVVTNGKLKGYNTDWLGIVNPIEKITKLKKKKVALIGAGGAARAAAYGVAKQGAKLAIFNRSLDKAKALAKEFGGVAYSLDDLEKIVTMDIVINTTSVGLDSNQTPIPKEFLNREHIVFDAIYSPYETRLLKDAKKKGARVIHGLEMLLQQGIVQFKLYTGKNAPEDIMRQVLLQNIK